TFAMPRDTIIPDTLVTAENIPEPFLPAFKRTGYAVKLGFGKKDRFVDLVYFKGKDDTASITYAQYATLIKRSETAGHDTVALDIKPQENAALGIVARGDFMKKVFLEIDGAVSIYTRDLLAKAYDNSDFAAADALKPFITVRSSTQLLAALITRIEYRHRSFKIGFGYDRITPDYETMAVWYFQNDVQRFTLSSAWQMLKKKMSVTAKIGLEKNNLLATLATTSTRTLALLNVFWMAGNNTHLNIFYSNHQQNVANERGTLADSLLLAQAVNVASASLHHRWGSLKRSHLLNIIGNYQSSRQHNDSEDAQNIHAFNLLPDYSITFEKAQLTLLTGFEYNQFLGSIRMVNYGPVIGVTQHFLKKKMTASLRANVSFNYFESNLAAVTGRAYFNFTYRLISRHLLKLRLIYLKNAAKKATMSGFSEMQGEIGYTVQF
ncbi:MAG TPA: hypothetical protein VNJ07_05875, partial [Chitinophagales bacterium]|nr:hypothetical protein [Chitinophagales bacterium]